MGGITLLVKHPHGRMTVIEPLGEPPKVPPRPTGGGRSPTVALVDAAVGSHPWLAPPTVVTTVPVGSGSAQGPAVGAKRPYEAPVTEHGTFDAGIIRQLAPGAEIVSVPVLDASGEISHDDVLAALAAIHARITHESAPSFVDVVCLPFGYLADEKTEEHRKEERRLLAELVQLGVLVVAAAGNDGPSAKIYPAAFAPELKRDGYQMLSVGALDLEGRHAGYSASGPWVTHWERGMTTSVVANPDEGYAVGEGTSFAAARVAAKLATILLDDPSLSDVSPAAAIARADRAVARLS